MGQEHSQMGGIPMVSTRIYECERGPTPIHFSGMPRNVRECNPYDLEQLFESETGQSSLSGGSRMSRGLMNPVSRFEHESDSTSIISCGIPRNVSEHNMERDFLRNCTTPICTIIYRSGDIERDYAPIGRARTNPGCPCGCEFDSFDPCGIPRNVYERDLEQDFSRMCITPKSSISGDIYGFKLASFAPCAILRSVHEGHYSNLENIIALANSRRKHYYIGYTAKKGSYLCYTLPKSEEWKKKFHRGSLYFADIGPSMGKVTERILIDKYRADRLCVNGPGGKIINTGYVYVVIEK